MSRKIDITDAQHKEILSLLKKYLPDTKVWAYGSRINSKSHNASDLDIVAFALKDQKDAVDNLREAFEESDLPFRVDLFVWDEVPQQFQTNIEKDHFVLQ